MEKIPFLTEVLEPYAKTSEGIPLWKTIELKLDYENMLDNLFILSTDMAAYFEVRHDNLCTQNILKLKKDGYLHDQLLKVKELIHVGKSAQKPRIVYALTRHQAEHLISEFYGPKARHKKHVILNRLQSIERDVLLGDFAQARQKACTWDGVQILKDLGFTCSIPNNIATKKDITTFLKIPESTLNNFLRKYREDIKPISLNLATIQSIGGKAKHMNGYTLEDVTKITFGMNTEKGIEAKKRLFGNIGNFVKIETKGEIEWRNVLSKVFEGFDLRYNHPIGNYRVDFFIPDFFGFGLCLECNGYCHKYYDLEEDKRREEYIRERYALVRFHHKISLEDLVNGILKAKPKEVITLYNIEQLV